MDKREAITKMAEEFNAIDRLLINRALIGEEYQYADNFIKYKQIVIGDYVVYPESSEIIEISDDGEEVRLDGFEDWYDIDELEFEDSIEYGGLPMWSTMWQTDILDYRINREGQVFLNELKEIGILVWDTEIGTMIGIDGAGYSFFDEHWSKLYDLLGYAWHDNNNED